MEVIFDRLIKRQETLFEDELEKNSKNENPSLCIPRVHCDITKEDVYSVFNRLRLGNIQSIDMIRRYCEKSKEEYKVVFVHFAFWYRNPQVDTIKERILSGEDIKIVHQFPWYWKIFIYKIKKKIKFG